MSKEIKWLNQQWHTNRREQLKKILEEFFIQVIAGIIRDYDYDYHFLRIGVLPLAMNIINPPGRSNAEFFTLSELTEFLLINKEIYKIILDLIREHFYSLYSEYQDCKPMLLNPEDSLGEIKNYLGNLVAYNLKRDKPLGVLQLKTLILTNIFSPDSVVEEESLIVHAVKNNSLTAVRFLLEKKAEVKSAQTIDEDNLITIAFKLGYINIVKMLLTYFDPISPQLRSYSKQTLLMQVIDDGDIKWITQLLPEHLPQNNSHELLNLAVGKKSLPITSLLLQNNVKIQSDSPNFYSPLQTFVDRCHQTSYEEVGYNVVEIIQNFRCINNMFELLLKHGDRIENIPDCRRIFYNDQPVLARVIISHGGDAEEINALDILVRLVEITHYLEKARDWDTLFFWLDLLNSKLSNSEQTFQHLLEQALATYAGALITLELFSSKISSSEKYLTQIWHIFSNITNNAKIAQAAEDWSHIHFFATRLTKNTKKYLAAIWYENKPSISRRNSDASDLKNSGMNEIKIP